jgi:predicted ribosome quality control (RQC) complex YloA/Tae2 family protein
VAGEITKTQKEIDRELRNEQLAAKARLRITNEIRKYRRLISNLRNDLDKHGDADRWKHFGDLLLANISTASRNGDSIFVTDYFDESAPVIEIVGDRNLPISEIAKSYFRRYTKARNARGIIAERIAAAEAGIAAAELMLEKVNAAQAIGDEEFLTSLTAPRQALPLRQKKKTEISFNGARRFVSSDGIEILVGKKASDNDFLTFRVARSLDLWMHAADYPGSHVVVRSHGRKEIPNQTVLEAAQLAAFYSDAREQPKAAVHYTPKKFVNKPRKAAPGLVRLASFKTILVEPKVAVEKIEKQ